jgi:hypothetical protein
MRNEVLRSFYIISLILSTVSKIHIDGRPLRYFVLHFQIPEM